MRRHSISYLSIGDVENTGYGFRIAIVKKNESIQITSVQNNLLQIPVPYEILSDTFSYGP